MRDNLEPKVYKTVCYGCKETLGYATEGEESDKLALDHAPYCPITEEQHAQAVIDIKFKQLTNGLQ
jgi:hypothetical protein